MIEVKGVYAAAISPRGKQGDIDFGASFELIDFLCKGGVNGIALGAAAGEFAALSGGDRSRLVYLAVKRSRVPVLAGVGSATLDDSVALAREARDAGAAGLLLPPPHFFAYDQDDIREFYLQFAAQLGTSTATYIIQLPDGGTQVSPDTARELLAGGKFAGILTSNDEQYAAARAAGARAIVSPAACALPEMVAALDRAVVSGDDARTKELDARLQEFLAWTHQFPQPVLLKVATGIRGLKTGPLSVPLSPAKQKKLEEFREWFKKWLPAAKNAAAS
jgi:4-hydroxy-tetrahydrodipicolinate synthase